MNPPGSPRSRDVPTEVWHLGHGLRRAGKPPGERAWTGSAHRSSEAVMFRYELRAQHRPQAVGREVHLWHIVPSGRIVGSACATRHSTPSRTPGP